MEYRYKKVLKETLKFMSPILGDIWTFESLENLKFSKLEKIIATGTVGLIRYSFYGLTFWYGLRNIYS